MNVESMLSTIIVAVIGLAIVAVLVSQRAATAGVIGASGQSLAEVVTAAVSPITGGGAAPTALPNLLPGGGFGH